jgi:hypothetical protein
MLCLLLACVASALRVDAQAPKRETAPAELVRTIASLDSALFDSYNRCDLEKFATFWSDSAEFYHDQGGLTVGTQKLVDAVRQNICGKVRRELVPGTLEVYIMHDYGAVEMGVHRFHHPGRDDVEPVGEAKFIHLWQQRDGNWRITRVISYDHHPLPR